MNSSSHQSHISDRIYAIVRAIPKGFVLRYKDVAINAECHPRQVGYWLHHNPSQSKTPCHRVVNAQGRVAQTFAFGGAGVQEKMLREEGVIFTKPGQVDLSKSLWSAFTK
jgi:methylated-DNA-protein-cysteine methyltransferase-like protein